MEIVSGITMWVAIVCLCLLSVSYSFHIKTHIGISRVNKPFIARNRDASIVSKPSFGRRPVSSLALSESVEEGGDGAFDPAAWINPNTRGGVIVWSIILVTIPVFVYYYFVGQGLEPTKVGSYVGALFVLLSNVLWASTYIFRVANKDMTYAKQLRDYENAVLEKRLEELDEDEIDALLEEIEEESDE